MANEERVLEVLDEGQEDSGEVNACCAAGATSSRK